MKKKELQEKKHYEEKEHVLGVLNRINIKCSVLKRLSLNCERNVFNCSQKPGVSHRFFLRYVYKEFGELHNDIEYLYGLINGFERWMQKRPQVFINKQNTAKK